MTSDVIMVIHEGWGDVIMDIHEGWGLLMFLEPLSKCSGGFSYVFFITLHPVTFISVDDSTFLQYRIFVLWNHQEVFDGTASFKMDLHPVFVARSLHALTQPFVVWHQLCMDSGCSFGYLHCCCCSSFVFFGLVFLCCS